MPVPEVPDARPQPPAVRHTAAGGRRPRAGRRAAATILAALVAILLLPGAALAEEPPTPPDPAPSAGPAASASPSVDPSASPGPSTSPGGAPTATPTPAVVPTLAAMPAPTPVLVTRNLYRAGAAVTQYTSTWCVPASVQTMTNLILGTRDTSYATQKLLASVTYRFNRYRYNGPGNDIRGWAGALNWRLPDTLPVAYRDRSYATRTAALAAIVDAIDETGYPVGITVRHGGHAWAVAGYRISQVPNLPGTREILGFYVMGPLGSPRDPWPVRYMAVGDFLGQYNRYYEDREREPWHLDYVLVRPEPTTGFTRDWPRP